MKSATEWTGARYVDNPTVEVSTHVAASPERIWPIISDVVLMAAFCDELQRAEWLDGATVPAVGAHFRGHNRCSRRP